MVGGLGRGSWRGRSCCSVRLRFDYGSTTVQLRLDYGMVALPPWSEESGAGRAAGRRIFHLSGRSRARSSTFTMFIPTTTTATPPATNLYLYFCLYLSVYLLKSILSPFLLCLYQCIDPLPLILIEKRSLDETGLFPLRLLLVSTPSPTFFPS